MKIANETHKTHRVYKDIVGPYIPVTIEQMDDFIIVSGEVYQVKKAIRKLEDADIGLHYVEELSTPDYAWLIME